LAEAIMKYENLLKELIKDSVVPGELKEKLCSSFDDSDIAGMFLPFECQKNRHSAYKNAGCVPTGDTEKSF
jgi:hypothetical protein